MNIIENHKEIMKVSLYQNGGLVIIFEDTTHTFIEPELMKEIVKEYKLLEEDE